MRPAVSFTGIVVASYEFFCRPPHQKYGPSCVLTSRSSLVVTGDVQVIWVIEFGRFSTRCSASGEAIVPEKVVPELEPPWMQCWQICWRSDQKLNLFFGVACQVNRRDPFFHRPSSIGTCSGRPFLPSAGRYVHFVLSPAFRFTHMLATFWSFDW